jgi:DNA-binding MarR family transcriptional regulator
MAADEPAFPPEIPPGAWTARAIGEACVCFQLRRAARLVSRRYEEALAATGLKAGQFSILAALIDGRALTMSGLADRLGMDRTTLTRNLRPLQRRQLVAVAPLTEDRRSRAIVLTDGGRALMDQALPLWQQAQADSLARLGEDGVAGLKRALRTVAPP